MKRARGDVTFFVRIYARGRVHLSQLALEANAED